MLGRWKKWFSRADLTDAEIDRQRRDIVKAAPVPRIWLFGKTGSGKSSIIRYLTGATDAEIGNGFRPETKFSRQYAFPNEDAPLMRFVDTRGLGEARYDAAEDIAKFDDETHLMIVVVRAMDHALSEIVQPLSEIRRSRRDRPVLLALTCLHEAYPGQQHPEPDPFSSAGNPDAVPDDLRRCLEQQKSRFSGLIDEVVPIDLTEEHEGFHECELGGDRLKDAVIRLLPAAYRHSVAGFEEARKSLRSLNERRALPEIVSHSVLAATAAAVPVPWVDIPGVLGIQSNLVRRIARIYGQEMSSSLVMDMAGAAGSRMLLRMLVREPLKLIPFVGMAANAALSFAYTFGLGKAACWYFGELKHGNTPSMREVEAVWMDSISMAKQLWKRAGKNADASPPPEEPR